MSRIDRLTDAHKASFPAYVEKWTAIGRSTEPMDRERASSGVADAYKAAGLEPPLVFFASSPVGGAIARELIVQALKHPSDGVSDGVSVGVWDGVGAGVGAGVWAGVRAGVGAGVGEGVWAGVREGVGAGVGEGVGEGISAGVGDGVSAGVSSGVGEGVRAGVSDGVSAGVSDGVGEGVGDGVSAGVWDGVWAGVWAGVWDGVSDGVGAGVRAGVRAGVGAGVWDGVSAGVRDGWHKDLLYGAHSAAWVAQYDWYARHGLDTVCAPLKGITQVAESAGWWWAHKGFAVVSDRPATLHDELIAGTTHRRRLHNADGPSVTYRDGWGLWHWHGQLVPQWVIDAPTVEAINRETNTEIRRCGIESLGWDRYLRVSGVEAVSVEPDPGNGDRLLRLFDLPDSMQVYGGPVRLLVMENGSRDLDGTRRVFAETVPESAGSAVEAAAWQFDVPVEEYRLLARAS